jgi:alpha-tubulin suppressor-like RCC1 family protein
MIQRLLILTAFVSTLLVQTALAAAGGLTSKFGHALAVNSAGQVYAWGGDSFGQLGVGRTLFAASPARIAGLPALTAISASLTHVAAVDTQGQLWTWGDDLFGNLGIRDRVSTKVPARVRGVSDVIDVAAGLQFTLALRRDGSLVGIGTDPTTDEGGPVPQVLDGVYNIRAISAGWEHALALRSDGLVFSAGTNVYGQQGDGSRTPNQQWYPLTAAPRMRSISASNYSSAGIGLDGNVYAWGSFSGQVSTATLSPRQVRGLPAPAVHVTAGRPFGIAALTDGSAWVWDDDYQAVPIPGITGIRQVAMSFNRYDDVSTAYLLAGNGILYTAGGNIEGQRGLGSVVGVEGITAVPNHAFSTIRSGGSIALAIKADGSTWIWGASIAGELADGSITTRSVPTPEATGLTGIVQVSAGRFVSAARSADGRVYTWGDNGGGQLGDGTRTRRSRAAPAAIDNVVDVAAGQSFILYARRDGSVWVSGVLTNGVQPLPTMVPGLSGVTRVFAAGQSAYAVTGAGQLYAWGINDHGQLGDGTTTNRTTPTLVRTISSPVREVSANEVHALAVTSDGRVWAWGRNTAGQLGNGSVANENAPILPTPTPVPGISAATSVAAGAGSSYALLADGTIVAWGSNAVGQLGDGTEVDHYTPAPVRVLTNVQAIASGALVAYAMRTDGTVWAWGGGISASFLESVGDGVYDVRRVPVLVSAPNGGGNLDSDNWYLDLDPGIPNTVPSGVTPALLSQTQFFGSQSNASLTASISYRARDAGRTVNNYVMGLVPREFLNQALIAQSADPMATANILKRSPTAKADSDLVLVQLTPTGWQAVTGQLTALTTNVAGASGTSSTILNNINLAKLNGAQFCVGYGTDAASMIQAGTIGRVLALPGATSTSGGVPCVKSGVYLDGPDESRTEAPVSFGVTVVGAQPTGTVALRDASTTVATVALAAGNSPVFSGASISLANLGAGRRTLSAAYAGDGQNPSATSNVVTHLRRATATVTVEGPAGGPPNVPLTFTARVSAANPPSGQVQFHSDGVKVGPAINLSAGVAQVNITEPLSGAHTVSAEYLGSDAHAPATSNQIVYLTAGATTTPAAFSFAARAGVPTGSLATSAPVRISGINAPAPVTVSNGEYSVGCLPGFTRSPGVIYDGQTICVRHFAANQPGQSVTSTLSIGGVSASFVSTSATGVAPNYGDIWYSVGEDGHGMAMIQKGNLIFLAWYLYDAGGAPQWLVLPSGSWNSTFSEYSGPVYIPRGSFYAAYDERQFNVGNPVGSVTLRFTGAGSAVLNYSVNGVSGSKNIVRFAFGQPASQAPGQYGDLWYGGAGNNGWGVSVSQQFGQLFVAWYTYDRDGKPLWFVVPAGSFNNGLWTGTAYRTTGTAVLGAAFNPALVRANPVGSVSIQFREIGTSTMTYDIEGQRGSYPLERLNF